MTARRRELAWVADGAYTANAAANHIGAATSLVNADDILDAAVKSVQDDVDQNESDSDQR